MRTGGRKTPVLTQVWANDPRSLTGPPDEWVWRQKLASVEQDLQALAVDLRSEFTILSRPLPNSYHREFAAVGKANPWVFEWGQEYSSVLPSMPGAGTFLPFLDIDYDDGDKSPPSTDDMIQDILWTLTHLIVDMAVASPELGGLALLEGEEIYIQIWKNMAPDNAPPSAISSYHAYATNIKFPIDAITLWKHLVQKRNVEHKLPGHKMDIAQFRSRGSLRLPTSANKHGYVMYPALVATLIGNSVVTPDGKPLYEDVYMGEPGDPTEKGVEWSSHMKGFRKMGIIAGSYGFTGEPVIPKKSGRPATPRGVAQDCTNNLRVVTAAAVQDILQHPAVAAFLDTLPAFADGNDEFDDGATRSSAANPPAVTRKREREAPAASSTSDPQTTAATWVLQNRIGKVGIANTIDKAPADVRNAAIIKIDELEYGVAFTANTTWCMIKGDYHRNNKLHVVMTPSMLWCQCFSAKCREKLENVLGNQAQTHSGLPVYWGAGAVKPVFNRRYTGFVVDKPRSTEKEQDTADKLALYGSFDDSD